MKIFIGRLRKEPGAREDFNYTLAAWPELGDLTFTEPIDVQGSITNTGGDFLDLVLHIKTEVQLTCSRCLDPVSVPLELEATEQYCHEEEREKYFDEGQADSSAAVTILHEDWLELRPLVQETLLLGIPMRVLCQDDCPGLCPSCGQNLKEARCACPKQEPDPRLAVLSQLRKKLNP
jgi:uncharacterized protein